MRGFEHGQIVAASLPDGPGPLGLLRCGLGVGVVRGRQGRAPFIIVATRGRASVVRVAAAGGRGVVVRHGPVVDRISLRIGRTRRDLILRHARARRRRSGASLEPIDEILAFGIRRLRIAGLRNGLLLGIRADGRAERGTSAAAPRLSGGLSGARGTRLCLRGQS